MTRPAPILPTSDLPEFPVFETPQKPVPGESMEWTRVMEETEAVRRYHAEYFDNPAERLASKNPEPFEL